MTEVLSTTEISTVVPVPVPASMRRQKDPNRGKIKPSDFAIGDVVNAIRFGQGRFQPIIKGPLLVTGMVHHFITFQAMNDDGTFNPNGKVYNLTARTLFDGQTITGRMEPQWSPQPDYSADNVDEATLESEESEEPNPFGSVTRVFPGL